MSIKKYTNNRLLLSDKTYQVNCYYCQSCNCSKWGKSSYNGKQQYKCKDCQKLFIYPRIVKQKDSQIICYHCGANDYRKAGKSSYNGKQQYKCKVCNRSFSEGRKQAQSLPLSDDVWLAEDLGLIVPKHRREKKLIFSNIEQPWLKNYSKKFIRYMASTGKQFGTILSYLKSLRDFSNFLFRKQYSVNSFNQIDRTIILNYLDDLSERKLNFSSKNDRLGTLRLLFDTGMINKWFEVEPHLIRHEDYPTKTKRLPRYIPEDVLRQLNQHLDYLPQPVMRMVLVLQECGLRIGELCQLPLDCLKQDNKGSWYIQFMRWKMLKEDTLPVSIELAKVIQEQQQWIKQELDENYNYLFCGRSQNAYGDFIPKSKVMSSSAFVKYLKELSKRFDIKDSSGKRWNFQSHQFRHTVGTTMINNGVPQHIIQRYLGHETPTMTSVYAHIHDHTLKKEIAKYHDSRVVNVAGEVVESTTPELDNDLDLHFLKKKVLAQSLPNGSCARPMVLGECPHANACLTCGDFRTTIEFLDQHKTQLEETEKLVKNAEDKGWKRHAEMNTKVRDNLKKIITTLESGNKDIVSGGGD